MLRTHGGGSKAQRRSREEKKTGAAQASPRATSTARSEPSTQRPPRSEPRHLPGLEPSHRTWGPSGGNPDARRQPEIDWVSSRKHDSPSKGRQAVSVRQTLGFLNLVIQLNTESPLSSAFLKSVKFTDLSVYDSRMRFYCKIQQIHSQHAHLCFQKKRRKMIFSATPPTTSVKQGGRCSKPVPLRFLLQCLAMDLT